MPAPLRVALLSYRGHPFVGGQGIYVRYMTRALTALGHTVTVFAGQPYPELDDGIELVRLPSLDLYNDANPFHIPHPRNFHTLIDLAEVGIMSTGAFGEPLTFGLRARRALRARRGDFDVVHDNQSLGFGLLGMLKDGWPLLTSFHHPIAVDRRMDIEHARTLRKRIAFRRWYSFTHMQHLVARRLPRVVTCSTSSRDDIARECGVDPDKIAVVPYGVDTDVFGPRPAVARVPGRLITTASIDVPLKGLTHLLEAVAKLRTQAHVELLVIGKRRADSRAEEVIKRFGLEGSVDFVSGVDAERLVELYNQAQVAVIPSLYEGFSLPAVEAMACGTPVVATTGGALPEVVGDAGLQVEPADAGALATAIARVLDEPGLATRMSAAGRARVLERFTWKATAAATAEHYREVIAAC